MHLTVLGSSGAFPTSENPCSGYLVEHEGFRILLDVGYAAFPALLRHTTAESIEAVVITHGHPDRTNFWVCLTKGGTGLDNIQPIGCMFGW